MVVDHGLRAEANAEAATAAQQAADLGFETVLLPVSSRCPSTPSPQTVPSAVSLNHVNLLAGCLARWASREGSHHGSSQADALRIAGKQVHGAEHSMAHDCPPRRCESSQSPWSWVCRGSFGLGCACIRTHVLNGPFGGSQAGLLMQSSATTQTIRQSLDSSGL